MPITYTPPVVPLVNARGILYVDPKMASSKQSSKFIHIVSRVKYYTGDTHE